MNVAKPADATPQLVHVAPYAMHSSRSPDACAPHSYGTESSTAGPSPSGVPKPVAVEYYGVGSTLLTAMADRAGLLVFGAGRSIDGVSRSPPRREPSPQVDLAALVQGEWTAAG